MIVMTAATGIETKAITRCLENKRKADGNGYRAWRGTRGRSSILAVQTGMGKQKVRNAMGAILEKYPADAIISLGFGGALNRELRTGDLVICAEAIEDSLADNRAHADDFLVRQAAGGLAAGSPERIVGKSVTVAEAVSSTVARQRLSDRFEAQVCEMEDFWISEMASARNIPFLAVRVIYDEFEETLTDYEKIVGTDGNVLVLRAITHFMAHPGRILKPGRFVLNYRRARKSLSNFVAGFLDAMGPVMVGE